MADSVGGTAAGKGTGRILLLSWLAAVAWVGGVLYVPSLPMVAADFGVSAAAAQVTFSAFMATFAIAHLVYGSVSDRYGRRPVLLASLVLFVGGSIAVALAPSVEMMVVARIVQAAGGVGGIMLGRAIVRDAWSFHEVRRPLALINAVSSMAPVASLASGGLLATTLGWRGMFWFVALLSAATLVVVWLRLPETHTRRDPGLYGGRRMVTNMLALLRLRLFWAYSITQAALGAAVFVFMTGAPFYVIGTRGLAPEIFGLLTGLLPLGFVTGSVLVSRLMGRFSIARLMIAGCVISVTMASLLCVAAAAGTLAIPLLYAGMFAYTFGLGITVPNAIAGGLEVRPQYVGAASALLGFVQLGLASLASLAVSVIGAGGGLPMVALIWALGASALAAAVAAVILQTRETAARDQAGRKSSGPPTFT